MDVVRETTDGGERTEEGCDYDIRRFSDLRMQTKQKTKRGLEKIDNENELKTIAFFRKNI